jgi:hypothetical protein
LQEALIQTQNKVIEMAIIKTHLVILVPAKMQT